MPLKLAVHDLDQSLYRRVFLFMRICDKLLDVRVSVLLFVLANNSGNQEHFLELNCHLSDQFTVHFTLILDSFNDHRSFSGGFLHFSHLLSPLFQGLIDLVL